MTASAAMTPFSTLQLPQAPTVVAPDGSDVRVLLGLQGGGMAHFSLAARQVASAVTHWTVEEIWFVLLRRGRVAAGGGGHHPAALARRGGRPSR
jgi:hypothetical protein